VRTTKLEKLVFYQSRTSQSHSTFIMDGGPRRWAYQRDRKLMQRHGYCIQELIGMVAQLHRWLIVIITTIALRMRAILHLPIPIRYRGRRRRKVAHHHLLTFANDGYQTIRYYCTKTSHHLDANQNSANYS